MSLYVRSVWRFELDKNLSFLSGLDRDSDGDGAVIETSGLNGAHTESAWIAGLDNLKTKIESFRAQL